MKSVQFTLKVSPDGQVDWPEELLQLLQAHGPVQVIAYVGGKVYEEPTEEEWTQFLLNNPAYNFLKGSTRGYLHNCRWGTYHG